MNLHTTAAPAYALFATVSGKEAHLTAADGGPFLCGATPGRKKWACHGTVPGVPATFGCAGCREAAPCPGR